MENDMNQNELMNKISFALKDATLAQGFEIICKRITELEKENTQLIDKLNLQNQRLNELKKENTELKEQNSILKNDVRVAREDRWRLQIKVGKGLREFIHDCPYTALKHYASARLVEENEELKEKLKGFENGDVVWQGDMDATIKQNLELKAQIEKMKCYENCKYGYYGNMCCKDDTAQCRNCDKWECRE